MQTSNIPVVEIGAAARNSVFRDNHDDFNLQFPSHSVNNGRTSSHAQQPCTPTDDTVVIGTSLVQGLGPRLNSRGIDATTYVYRGADIPLIQSRVASILRPASNPRCIVLQAGGNDACKESANRVVSRYESLIRDIRYRCPQSTLILSKIPPRAGNHKTMSTINEVNANIDRFASVMDNVYSVSVCPTSVSDYKGDRTHFNNSGMDLYARNLSGQLQNFSRLRGTSAM